MVTDVDRCTLQFYLSTLNLVRLWHRVHRGCRWVPVGSRRRMMRSLTKPFRVSFPRHFFVFGHTEREIHNHELRAVCSPDQDEKDRKRTAIGRLLPTKTRRFDRRCIRTATKERGNANEEKHHGMWVTLSFCRNGTHPVHANAVISWGRPTTLSS